MNNQDMRKFRIETVDVVSLYFSLGNIGIEADNNIVVVEIIEFHAALALMEEGGKLAVVLDRVKCADADVAADVVAGGEVVRW